MNKYTSKYTDAYNKKDSHGKHYESVITTKADLAFLEVERHFLREIHEKYFANKKDIKYLDFAIGTGRVASFFYDRVNQVVGLDTSTSMLEVAKGKMPNGEFITGNIAEDSSLLGGRKFDLITAFRLFLNLESENRTVLLGEITKNLNEDGLFVFNNHMNRYSFMGMTAFILHHIFRMPLKTEAKKGKRGIINTMSEFEVRKMLSSKGMEIVKVYRYSFLPAYKGFLPLPKSIYKGTELLLSKIPLLNLFTKDQIYVCKKKS